MKYLEYKIQNMAISRDSADKTPLISGAVNYFGMHFDFGEEFGSIPGTKAVEFVKKNNKDRRDLVDGKCKIPNWLLNDKDVFQIRVISGNTIGTQWATVNITESGVIMPDEPEENAPAGTEYVKTLSGEYAVALIRSSTNGLEYSTDGGETWNSGVSGVPEVPARPKNAVYGRKNGDWVDLEEYLAESGGEANAIDEIKVNGDPLPVENKSANIDLSAYAEKETVEKLQTLQGEAGQLALLDYGETGTAAIVTKVNEIITLLQTRGIAAE